MRRVVITGVGMVTSVGQNVATAWASTLRGASGVKPITLFDTSRSTVKIAAEISDFNPESVCDVKEVRNSSRFIQMGVMAAKEAALDSGLDLTGNTDRYGCSIGVGIGAIDEIERTSINLSKNGPRRVSPFFIPYSITNMAAGLSANYLKLRGPNICTATACTSGTHAIGEAFLYISLGMADAMLAGGCEASICESSVAGFANMKALSRRNDDPGTACRPFDKDRDGFVMGEGAGALMLESYDLAKARGARIYAEVVGYGMSGDAYHITSPAPEGEGAQRCMRAALAHAKLNPEDVDYINAHGTSTYINDLYETKAIKHVFKDHAKSLLISSTKGATGHCLGGAGGIEGVFLAKALAEGIVPPTANLVNPDPECDLDYVPREGRKAKIKVGLSNSFGFGGTNGCIVMKSI